MTAVPANIIGFKLLDQADDVFAGETTSRIRRAVIYYDHGGVQVAGGTDTLDVVVATIVQNEVRNGKTATMRYFGMYGNAYGSNSTAYAATVANSSGTIQLTPKSVADYTTNATIAAGTTLTRPYALLVAWSEA